MKLGPLPTDVQMLKLKKELNFLLWTGDVPEIPEDVPLMVKCQTPLEPTTINLQCIGHMLVTAAIFMHLGFKVTTRRGMAFVVDTSPDGNQDNDKLNQIGKHWWLTIDDYGLVDLSLNAETEDPLICGNRSIGGRWHVAFGKRQQELNAFLKARQRGCFYLTQAKQRALHDELAQDLTGLFPPAKDRDIPLLYANLVAHTESLLSGSAESLIGLEQSEAWQKLAATD